MKSIVKVQLPLASSLANPPALVYAEGRKFTREMPVTEELRKRMGSKVKAFFHAEFCNGIWVLGEEAKEQRW